jgi:acyl-CoA hydrolase
MERLDFHHPIRLGQIAILKAFLIYVGRTSMEVMVEVYTDDPPTGTRKSTSTARITYVAIDAKGRPTAVPALRVVSEEERRRYDDAKRRREAEGRA